MKLSRLRRPRYADVAATLALIFALSGTAYAVATVNTADIVDGAVTTPKLHNGAVANLKIAADAVGTGKLADGAVTSPKIAGGGVITSNLADGAVTNPKLADDSVSNSKLLNGSVTNGKLANGSVTNGKLADGSVTNGKLADGSVTHSKLASNSVTGANVSSESLTLSDLLGINRSGAISFTLNAHSCGKLTYGVSGAVAGQAALLTFTTAPPTHVMFGPLQVVDATHIIDYACNMTGSQVSASGLGVRIVTFG